MNNTLDRREVYKKNYKKNRKKKLEYQKKYWENNKEKIKERVEERRREWYQANKEEILKNKEKKEKMNKNRKFVGNKIPMATYNRLVAYSEVTGRKQNRIMEEALNRYLDEEIPKQYEPKKD